MVRIQCRVSRKRYLGARAALIPTVAASFEKAVLAFRPIKNPRLLPIITTLRQKTPLNKVFYSGYCKLKFTCFGKNQRELIKSIKINRWQGGFFS